MMDEIARVNPERLPDPHRRRAAAPAATSSSWRPRAAEHGFTVVLGTNGVLLRAKQARLMETHGVLGASISLDSVDAARHDAFRHLPGAWDGAIRATEALRAEGIDFSLHMAVTDWNVGEIPAMIDLARELGAQASSTSSSSSGPAAAKGSPTSRRRVRGDPDLSGAGAGRGRAAPSFAPAARHGRRARAAFEDPWIDAGGARGRPPDPREVRAALPAGALRAGSRVAAAANYAHGSCPAGKYYCRITPTGRRHAVPVHAGGGRQPPRDRLRRALGAGAGLHRPANEPARRPLRRLRVLASSAAAAAAAPTRPTATTWPRIRPAATSRAPTAARLIRLGAEQTFGLRGATSSSPGSPRPGRGSRRSRRSRAAMVVKAVEAYARGQGQATVTPALLAEVRSRWGISPGRPFTPASGRPTAAGDG